MSRPSPDTQLLSIYLNTKMSNKKHRTSWTQTWAENDSRFGRSVQRRILEGGELLLKMNVFFTVGPSRPRPSCIICVSGCVSRAVLQEDPVPVKHTQPGTERHGADDHDCTGRCISARGTRAPLSHLGRWVHHCSCFKLFLCGDSSTINGNIFIQLFILLVQV